MSSAETLEDLLAQSISEYTKDNHKTVDDVAEMVGVSRATFYRHKKGQTKNGFTDKECMVKLVDVNIAPKETLPAYCKKCPIGEARNRLHCKKKGPESIQAIAKLS